MGYPDYDEGGRQWDPESQWSIAASGRNGSLVLIYGYDWIYRDFGATFPRANHTGEYACETRDYGIILGIMLVKPETMVRPFLCL